MDLGGARDVLLLKLLSASTLRARVIANNISNQNVPGFKRQVVRFEDLLSERIVKGELDPSKVEPRVETDVTTPAGPDGNNVSMELENSSMRENRLLYELYAAMLQSRASLIEASIKERG